jgi:hypothetical protein
MYHGIRDITKIGNFALHSTVKKFSDSTQTQPLSKHSLRPWASRTVEAKDRLCVGRVQECFLSALRSYTCSKISPRFVDRYKYTRCWPERRGTGREEKRWFTRLLAPPCPFHLSFTSYSRACRYFASGIFLLNYGLTDLGHEEKAEY